MLNIYEQKREFQLLDVNFSPLLQPSSSSHPSQPHSKHSQTGEHGAAE